MCVRARAYIWCPTCLIAFHMWERGECARMCPVVSLCLLWRTEGLSANERKSASQQVNSCHVRPLWHCKSHISMSARSRVTAAKLLTVKCSLWNKRVVSSWCCCECDKNGLFFVYVFISKQETERWKWAFSNEDVPLRSMKKTFLVILPCIYHVH